MNRIEILYDGHPYSVADTTADELKERILAAVTTTGPFWLTVNEGSGMMKATNLLIGPATQISLVEIRSD